MNKLFNISEASKKVNLVDPVTKKPLNYVLRYWEKEFKQIKPKKINKRRYYSKSQLETIKMIKFLLKNKGMTISGVRSLLNLNTNILDGRNNDGLKDNFYKSTIKNKSKNILEKIKKIKNYGKKNSS